MTGFNRGLHCTALAVLLVALLGVAGCTRGATQAAPPDIRYGEDICASCNMIISDPRFAAGYAIEIAPGRYESLAFDDIGDMLAHHAAHPDQTVAAWYVHDYHTEEWLDATAAFFVIGDEIVTPMGHGIAACATETAAVALADDVGGDVMAWSQLLAGEPVEHAHQ